MRHRDQREYWERAGLLRRRPPDHRAVAAYVASRIKAIRKLVPIEHNTKVLDVGCGSGAFTYHLDRICDVTGVDTSRRMLDMNPVSNVHLMDAETLDFPDKSFDIVLAHALLHHLDDPSLAVREMARVSKKWVVLMEPNRNNPLMFAFAAMVRAERATLRFTPSYVRRLAEASGVRVVDVWASGLLVPNKVPAPLAPLLARLDFRQPLGFTCTLVGEKG